MTAQATLSLVEQLKTAGAVGTVPVAQADGSLSMLAAPPAAHAASHIGAGSDPITSLGAHALTGHILPDVCGAYDLGADPDNCFRTLYLTNPGGDGVVLQCKDSLDFGSPTAYKMWLGGGAIGAGTGGGVFTFEFSDSTIGGENALTFDLGGVFWSSGTATNDVVFQAFSGLNWHRFKAAFGGFNNAEYGWVLDRVVQTADNNGKTLYFDNQDLISDFRRSIDLRIAGTNVLTVENSLEVDFPLRRVTAPTGLIVNGFTSLTSSTVFNLFDIFTVSPVNTNAGGILSVKPAGTSPTSAMLTSNSPSTTDYGTLENSLSGGIARFATWRLATGTGPSVLRIGEMTSAFFGVGITDSLTTIDFYFANAIQCQIQPDTLIFNNGATDCQIDWGTNGQLGLQVATNDIIRLTATQIQAIQDIVISDAQNIIVNASTGTKIGTATSQKLGLWNATPVIQQSSTGQTAGSTVGVGNNVNDDSTFTGGVGATAYTIGDIVRHLKTIGAIAQ